MADFGCSAHRIMIYERGGVNVLGEVFPVISVEWNRIRDDISTAHAVIGVDRCCDFLGSLETIGMEMHVLRNNLVVWQGPITRLEYQVDTVDIYAEDMLWVAKRTALQKSYSDGYPNIEYIPIRMQWLISDMTFALPSNLAWNVYPDHIWMVASPDDPQTSGEAPAWSTSTWDLFDVFAEDFGMDYTVVNRDIYFWDINYAWVQLPELRESHLGEHPRVVEYGNELGTRVIQTNGEGYAGLGLAPAANRSKYGNVDIIHSTLSEGTNADDDEASLVTEAEIRKMWSTAARQVRRSAVPPVSIVIPANTTLLPGSSWRIEDMIPGAWFDVSTESLCRNVTETQRLHQVTVIEDALNGEKVLITCISAPAERLDP